MARLILLLGILCAPFLKAHGQCAVYQNKNGQVLTTCDFYDTGKGTTASHRQETYLGSPYLTFPVWQEGKVWLDKQGKELTCELAYNLVTNEVLCRFADDPTVKTITPEVFIINNVEFVRQQNKLLGIDYRIYSTVLRNGQTKLLTSSISQLEGNYSSPYNGDIKGIYRTKTNYYIRKGDAKPEPVTLTRSSVLSVLYDQAAKVATKLPTRQLTLENVIDALSYYDTLMGIAQVNKQPLSVNPVFTQVLHDKLTYPDYARNQGIYGRVYAGFDVDEQGNVKNIVLLSPDNGGFRFNTIVTNALEKLPTLDPAFQGKYVLPVAFTYTNTKEAAGTHIPVNYLPSDRMEGRILLEEYVVPATITKPVTSSQEVWGYYK